MAFELRDFSGNAVQTTLASGVGTGDTTIVIADATGWPTGAPGPFFFDIDTGQSTHEKCKATGRTGTSITGVTRGADDSTAASHAVGAVVRHVFSATDAEEANRHYSGDESDPHSTKLLNTTRHDTTTRHGDASLGTPSTPAAVSATAAAAGTGGSTRAYHDHVHLLPAAVPRGRIGFAERSSNLALTTSDQVVASVAVTTALNNRYIKVTGHAKDVNAGSGNVTRFSLSVRRNGGSNIRSILNRIEAGGEVTCEDTITTAATITYELVASVNHADGGTLISVAAADRAFIIVEDIGGT